MAAGIYTLCVSAFVSLFKTGTHFVFSLSRLSNFLLPLERRTWQLMECIETRAIAKGVVNMAECLSHWAYDCKVGIFHLNFECYSLQLGASYRGKWRSEEAICW